MGSPGDAARPGADLGDLQTALERKRCMQRGRAGNLPATGGGELPAGGVSLHGKHNTGIHGKMAGQTFTSCAAGSAEQPVQRLVSFAAPF